MANVPIYNLTDTWNAGGTTFDAIKMAVTDTASASGSRLLELLVGGASKFRVDKAGNVTAAGTLGVTGATTLAAVGATNITASGTLGVTGATTLAAVGATNITASGTLGVTGATTLAGLSATNGTFSGTLGVTGAATLSSTLAVTGNTTLSGTLGVGGSDCILLREAANALAMRNGVNAQTLRLYNTYTDASNYERGFLRWDSDKLFLGTESLAAGVAGTARAVQINVNGTRTAMFYNGIAHFGTDAITPTSLANAPLYISRDADAFTAGVANLPVFIHNPTNTTEATGIGFGISAQAVLGAKILHYRQNTNSVGGLAFFTRDTAGVGVVEDLTAERMRITDAGSIGIGTTVPGRRLDVNDASGNCLRLTYNDSNGSAANYADFLVSSSGDLTITPSGGDVAITGAVETAAPSGGTAAKWKLGTVASVSPTSPDRTIEVEIGGTTYYLAAKTTND